MTNEEAITNLKMIGVAFVEPVTEEQRKLIDDTFDMAIKALEQKHILDKIRAEIDDTSKCFAVFKMPESCADCPLCVLPDSSNNTGDWKCALLDEIILCDIFDKRWKLCKLKEIEK